MSSLDDAPYRILMVSKLWVTVTAPHAAMPPAMNELQWQSGAGRVGDGLVAVPNSGRHGLSRSCGRVQDRPRTAGAEVVRDAHR